LDSNRFQIDTYQKQNPSLINFFIWKLINAMHEGIGASLAFFLSLAAVDTLRFACDLKSIDQTHLFFRRDQWKSSIFANEPFPWR